VGNSVRTYKFTPTVRTVTLTLDFTNQTLALDVNGALEYVIP
jgi:hypothetical protein